MVEKAYREALVDRADEEADKLWHARYGEDKEGTEEQPEDAKAPPEASTEPVTDTQDKPVTEPVVIPEPKPDDKDWKQMYKTLEGKYRAEVPRLTDEAKRLRDSVNTLNAKISELEANASANTRKEAAIGEKEIEQLEADYPDIGKIVKRLQDAHTAELAALEAKFSSSVSAELGTVRQDLIATKEQQFDHDMRNAGVTDWQTIDTDPAFHEWLADLVPYTRFTKLEALRDAAGRFDAAAVSKFFLDYKASLNREEAPVEGKSKLEKFVAPPSTQVATQQRSSAQPGFTRADFVKFMQDSARGKFNPAKWGGKTEAEVERMFDALVSKGQL